MKRSPPGKGKTELPGLHKVPKRLQNGRWRLHVYAWRGGPSIASFEAASKELAITLLSSSSAAAKLAAAYAELRDKPIGMQTLADVLAAYEASESFRRKSASTKQRERSPLQDVRESKLGKLPLKALAAKGARAVIEKWREGEGQTRGPRAADIRVGLISKALSWGIEQGHVTVNPARGIHALHDSDRSEVIFLKKDLEAFEVAARAARRKLLKKDEEEPNETPVIVLALLLVCYTGLRREDLCNLTWSEVQDHAIVLRPRKSLRRAQTARKSRKAPYAIIPITPELRAILKQCDPGEDKRGPWVLISTRGAKYTPSGLTSSFIKTRDAANIVDEHGRKKSLHDGRGTFVTYMCTKGIPVEDVAKMVGWSTQDVDQLAKKYVHAERVALAWIERLSRNASGT